MGIYINGMEMPTVGMCKTITIFDDGAVVEGNGSEKLGIAVPAADVWPRWIPVSERLPEEKTSVLVYKHGDWIQPAKRIDICKYLGDEVFYLLNVTHWMPLPERPKEE